MTLRIAYETIGCRLNQTETMQSSLTEENLGRKTEVVSFRDHADIYILNSCSVTEASHQKSLKALKQAYKRNPRALLVAMGCAVSYQPEDFAELNGVAVILGVQNRDKLLQEIQKHLAGAEHRQTLINTERKQGFLSLPPLQRYDSTKSRGYLKIQDGCSLTCRFCIVTIVRGASVSCRKDDIVRQAEALIQAGYREIVLTGVNIGEFSFKLKPFRAFSSFRQEGASDLQKLLSELIVLHPGVRYRISSINPENVNTTLLRFMDREPQICKHLHLSIQAGSDRILRKMKRPYRTARIRETLLYLKQSCHHSFGIGADILTGFPTETEQEFEETYCFIKEHPFSYLHLFPYSLREKTTAASLSPRCSENIIQQRMKKLRILAKKKQEAYLQSFIGKKVDILIEATRRKKDEKIITGTTSNFLKVRIPLTAGENPPERRSIVSLLITGASENSLLASLSEKKEGEQK